MDAPFDRGEVDRASLDATERLRARLSSRPAAPPSRTGRGFLPWAIVGALFVFVAGMIANPWFEARVRNKLPFTAAVTTNAAETTELADLRARLARLETPVAAPPPVERLARTEAKIETSSDQIARDAERIDKLTADLAALRATHQADRERSEVANATAIAAADRAQVMLTLVLVRRAVDAGRPLGALDGALHRAFETRYPDAVRAVSALGSAPVTLAGLRRDFNLMRPAIGARPAAEQRQSWWDALTSAITSAVSSPDPGGPLGAPEAATAALNRGDYLAAAKQLRRLPGPRPTALSSWLAAAERLNAGNLALATLETGTLLAQAVQPVAAAPPAEAAPPPVIAPVPSGGAAKIGMGGALRGALRDALNLRPLLDDLFGGFIRR